MKKLTHVFAAFAFILTFALANVTVVRAEEPVAQTTEPSVDPASAVDPSADPEPVVDPSADPEPVADPSADPEPVADPSANPEPVADPSADPASVVVPSADPASVVVPLAEPSEPVDPSEPTNAPAIEEQAASAHLSSGNVWGRDERTDVIDLSGEVGDEIKNYFKINFDHSTLIGQAFYNNDNLSGYCTNLPTGISLIKYTNTGGVLGGKGADYMRVYFSGTLQEATHSANVSITIPKEKLIAYDGYYIPEEGITVSLVVTVNGEPVVITVPVEAVSEVNEVSEPQEEVYRPTEWEKWISSVVEQIKKAPENGIVEITTKLYTGYTKRVIDALAERSDVTLVTNYINTDGNMETLTIPAGTFSAELENTANSPVYNANTTITDEPVAMAGSVEQATSSISTVAGFVQDKFENNHNFFNFNAFTSVLNK